MRLGALGLVAAFAVADCRPIDGVVVGTAPPGNAATPIVTVAASATRAPVDFVMQEYPVTRGQGPHDVAPARDGGVWYTAQLSGELGWLDPRFGVVKAIKLGAGSAPHGVIVGPDGAAWVTDGGLNAILRVDPSTNEVKRFPLPADRPNASLNTATFDRDGTLWFTGQNGIFGRLDPRSGAIAAFDMGSRPAPTETSTTRLLRAAMSAASTARPAARPSSSHPPEAKARGASGATPKAASG